MHQLLAFRSNLNFRRIAQSRLQIDTGAMLVNIQTYEVLAGFVQQFTRAFGSEGCWAALFSKSDGFWGRQLLEGTDGTYLTIDQWRSECEFANFMGSHKEENEALSRMTEGWVLEEGLIGRFRCSADTPARYRSAASLAGEPGRGEETKDIETLVACRRAPRGWSVARPSRG